MRTKSLIASLALSILVAGQARAATIAGWDFSQYISPGGFLSIDGTTLTNTLGANYSNLDTSFNLGPDSAVFGTMYINGDNGSTNVVPTGTGDEAFLPVSGSLSSNLSAPVQAAGDFPFDSLVELGLEGQFATELMSMSVFGPLSVVFAADLTSVPEIGSTWSISFGGKTAQAGTGSQVTIEFSTNGINYINFGSVNLTDVDTAFSVNLGTAQSEQAFVRLGFVAQGQPLLDNVAIGGVLSVVPEPATAALLLVGLAGLARTGRSRS